MDWYCYFPVYKCKDLAICDIQVLSSGDWPSVAFGEKV